MTMTNIKQKSKTRKTTSFAGQTINLGLDVHKKNWSVSVYLNDTFIRTFQILIHHSGLYIVFYSIVRSDIIRRSKTIHSEWMIRTA